MLLIQFVCGLWSASSLLCTFQNIKLVTHVSLSQTKSKITSMFKNTFINIVFCFLHSDFLKLKISRLDPYFGLWLVRRGQTAALHREAGHGSVCFLSALEFIWARSYKHMNGPQCADSVLTSPHQCGWDTLVKSGTHHGPAHISKGT